MTTLTIPERVQNGMNWLDQNKPGWIDKINLSKLELTCRNFCILGQVYGEYNKALDNIFSRDYTRRLTFSKGHGFNLGYEESAILFMDLNDEWKKQILLRRSQSLEATPCSSPTYLTNLVLTTSGQANHRTSLVTGLESFVPGVERELESTDLVFSTLTEAVGSAGATV